MNSLKPRPPFQVLVLSEESCRGREAIETVYALKQLVQAGVRVFFYLEDREQTLDSPTNKIMMSLTIRAWDPRQPGAFDSAAICRSVLRLGSSVNLNRRRTWPVDRYAERCERRR